MKKSKLSRLSALMLALIMVFTMALPAFAYDDNQHSGNQDKTGDTTAGYTVNIIPTGSMATPDDFTDPADGSKKTDAEKRFQAYEIFKGNINYGDGTIGDNLTDYDPGYWEGDANADPGYNDPKANWLSNITWGSGVEKTNDGISKLLAALINDETPLSDVKITKDDIKDEPRYESAFFDRAAAIQRFNTTNHADPSTETWGDLGSKEAYETALASYLTNEKTTALNDATLDLGDLFKAALKYAGYAVTESSGKATAVAAGTTGDTTLDYTASIVARVLSDFSNKPADPTAAPADTNNNAALARAFADVLNGKTTADHNGFLSNMKVESSWDTTDEAQHKWKLHPLSGGYYLIKDVYTGDNTDGDTDSDFVMGVFGNSTIYAKSKGVESDKTIPDPAQFRNVGDYEIGEEIPFELTGKLPQNYSRFDYYYVAFHDTMSKGLDYLGNENLHVYVTIKNPAYDANDPSKGPATIKINIDELNGGTTLPDPFTGSAETAKNMATGKDKFYIKNGTDAAGGTTLDVYFPDVKSIHLTDLNGANGHQSLEDQLKKLLGAQFETNHIGPDKEYQNWTEFMETLEIGASDVISVDYSAALNEKSAIDGPELNTFYLEYTDGPSNDNDWDTGTTTKKTVYVYDFGVDLYKYDISTSTKDALQGAGFTVTKSDDTWYKLQKGNDIVWMTATELAAEYGYTPGTWDDELLTKTLGELGTGPNKNEDGYYAGYKFVKTGNGFTTTDKLYAIMGKYTNSSVDPAREEHYIAGWISETELLTYFKANVAPTLEPALVINDLGDVTEKMWQNLNTGKAGNVDPFDKAAWGEGIDPATGMFYIAAVTPNNGKLIIKGMDRLGKYALSEVIVPEGFDKLEKDIEVTFTADYFTDADITRGTCDDATNTIDHGHTQAYPEDAKSGMLKNLTAKVKNLNATDDNEVPQVIVIDGYWADVNGDPTTTPASEPAPANSAHAHLLAKLDVANKPNGWLPGTGGMGTTLFYIAGGLLLALAAAYLLISNRKSRKDAE